MHFDEMFFVSKLTDLIVTSYKDEISLITSFAKSKCTFSLRHSSTPLKINEISMGIFGQVFVEICSETPFTLNSTRAYSTAIMKLHLEERVSFAVE